MAQALAGEMALGSGRSSWALLPPPDGSFRCLCHHTAVEAVDQEAGIHGRSCLGTRCVRIPPTSLVQETLRNLELFYCTRGATTDQVLRRVASNCGNLERLE